MTPAPDRIEELLAQSRVTGIDFIYVYPDQTMLDVYFLRSPATLDAPLVGTLDRDDVRIYSPSGAAPAIPVAILAWDTVDGRDVLRLQVAEPGDFTLYKLVIDDLRLDPYYNDVTFSFKANCPSDLDCAPPDPECPPEEWVDFPVDYLARDFWSFRRALLDFASQRYPDWPDRLEADAGIMLAEVMSALGDEMAYYQDRIGREAYLETATQRRSLRRHARLVDYTLHDGLGARAWVDVTIEAGANGQIPAGIDVWASGDGKRIDFEVGQGLAEVLAGESYYVDARWNELAVHSWDEDQVCLPVGATELFIRGHHGAAPPLTDPFLAPGKWLLLKTSPANPAQPERLHLVRLTEISNTTDPVFNQDITRLSWDKAQALPFEMDMTVLVVRGNLLPVTAGKTHTVYFLTGSDLSDLTPAGQQALQEADRQAIQPASRAIEREGRDGSVAYLFSLPMSDTQPLVWLGDDPHSALPEIAVTEVDFDGNCWLPDEPWTWRRSLLGVYSSQSQDRDYTLDDGTWRRVVGYQRIGEEFVHQDYASDKGVIIRFGDGEFGRLPAGKTVFRVDYRLGGGRTGNVAAESLRQYADDRQPGRCDPSVADLSFVRSLSNPLPASQGTDAETLNEARFSAPEAFRALTFRAVRPEDYAEAADRLPWVQRAGAAFRWTGSWLTAFVTPDPVGAVVLEETQRDDLAGQLNRFRQAGREAYGMDPVYANLDLDISVCAAPHAYPGEVKERVLEALLGKGNVGMDRSSGYFSPDRFTFGMPLERATLEATIQAVPGVRAVEQIRFRRRGWFDWKVLEDWSYDPGKNAIVRVENDPLHPERGTLKLSVHGGA